jgi:hypothetical protein
VSLTRGRQRTCPVVSGRRVNRYVLLLWSSPNVGGARGGELNSTNRPAHLALPVAGRRCKGRLLHADPLALNTNVRRNIIVQLQLPVQSFPTGSRWSER